MSRKRVLLPLCCFALWLGASLGSGLCAQENEYRLLLKDGTVYLGRPLEIKTGKWIRFQDRAGHSIFVKEADIRGCYRLDVDEDSIFGVSPKVEVPIIETKADVDGQEDALEDDLKGEPEDRPVDKQSDTAVSTTSISDSTPSKTLAGNPPGGDSPVAFFLRVDPLGVDAMYGIFMNQGLGATDIRHQFPYAPRLSLGGSFFVFPFLELRPAIAIGMPASWPSLGIMGWLYIRPFLKGAFRGLFLYAGGGFHLAEFRPDISGYLLPGFEAGLGWRWFSKNGLSLSSSGALARFDIVSLEWRK